MDGNKLAGARRALASVHSLRVVRARKAHDEAAQACEAALRSHEQVRSMLDAGTSACARTRQQLRVAGGVCVRAEDLHLLIRRLELQQSIVEALKKRVEIARRNSERAEDAARDALSALRRAIEQRDRVDETLEARVRLYRFARDRRAEERAVDDLASRNGAAK